MRTPGAKWAKLRKSPSPPPISGFENPGGPPEVGLLETKMTFSFGEIQAFVSDIAAAVGVN